jgi:hypothetical protein
MVYIKYY